VRKTLRGELDKTAGFKKIGFTIPHVFLPPRFKEISQKRNMILTIDGDLVPHVFWEGALEDSHHPLTPTAAKRLVRECLERMKKYRSDLRVLEQFLGEETEIPFWDPRTDSLTKTVKPEDAREFPFLEGGVGSMEEEYGQEGGGGERPMPSGGLLDEFKW
jgi:hypothetical protein